MAAITTTEEEKTYTRVSRLATEYFRLLCETNGVKWYTKTDGAIVHENEDGTYTITVSERNTYNLMQTVFAAQNGYEQRAPLGE